MFYVLSKKKDKKIYNNVQSRNRETPQMHPVKYFLERKKQ